ncbi:MAG: hypothetical protein IPI01_20000 [Ignavibacteriae bacterium]|nr:hypothetical protein [Ignavibacteriota bacterium]
MTPATFARYNLASTVIVLIILRLDVWLMGAFLPRRRGLQHRHALRNAARHHAYGDRRGTLPRASSHLTLDQIRTMMKKTFMLCGVSPSSAPCMRSSSRSSRHYSSAKRSKEAAPREVLCLRLCIRHPDRPVGIIGYSLGMVKDLLEDQFRPDGRRGARERHPSSADRPSGIRTGTAGQ